MEKKLFSIPKPSKCGTFISFNYWNAEKFCYKRFKKHLSRKIPADKRRAALAEMVEFWTVELKNGYNPFAEQKKEQQSTEMYRVGNVTQAICSERIKNLRSKSASTYLSKITVFLKWLEKNKIQNVLVVEFTQEQAENYLQYLLSERKLTATTRNAHLLTLRTFFSTMQKRGILKENVVVSQIN